MISKFNRRTLIAGGSVAAVTTALVSPGVRKLFSRGPKRIKIGVVLTEFTYRSHAHVLLENFLKPYIFCGEMIHPEDEFQIVSMYVDQYPEGKDMARDVAKQFGIRLAPTIREALTLGGPTLAVDAVLSIGEHGTYPYNELGQHLYPRKQFFDQIVAVMKESNRFVPIFNDKHFSYRWDWAKEMYDTTKELKIPFMAGSSVPMAQRKPMIAVPPDASFDQVLLVHGGGPESYDFHALEVLFSMIETRKGHDSGVKSVQCLQGDAIWQAAKEKRWNPDLVEVALTPELGDKAKEWRSLLKDPYLILVRMNDGFIAPLFNVPGNRWAFAYTLANQQIPTGCNFHVGPWLNRNLFKALAHAIQSFFRTGENPYPLDRTLMTTGITEAGMQSRFRQGAIYETPYLNFSYPPQDFAAFRENGKSWEILTDAIPEPKGIDPMGNGA